MNYLTILAFTLVITLQVHSQGYLIPNGVVTNLYPEDSEIDVWNPSGTQTTGFTLKPVGGNRFLFDEPVTIGVRVFFVAWNQPISLDPIKSQSYTELKTGSTYAFDLHVPIFVGLYTGYNFAPPYPPSPPFFYTDPVFGWARLANNDGAIQLLDNAVAYKADGIYAGTQTIIQPVPEPGGCFLLGLGLLFPGWLLACRRR